jgi:hypothetical protein
LGKALFLNFIAYIREKQHLFLKERTFLRKVAPKQADYEELAYDEKTTIYTKTALGNSHSFYSKGSFGLNNIVIEVFLTEHALESMRVAFNPFLTRGNSQSPYMK